VTEIESARSALLRAETDLEKDRKTSDRSALMHRDIVDRELEIANAWIRIAELSSGETHNEEALLKVRRALYTILGGHLSTDQRITDCISEMQNQGILFRERADRG
jgi:hypothetical protein